MNRIEIYPPETLSIGKKYNHILAWTTRRSDLSYGLFSIEYMGIKFWVSEQIEGENDYGYYCITDWQVLKDKGETLDIFDKNLGI